MSTQPTAEKGKKPENQGESPNPNASPKMAKPVTGTFDQRRKELPKVVKSGLNARQQPRKQSDK